MSETFIANQLYNEAIKKQIAESKPAIDETPAASYIFSDFPKYYTGAQTIIYIGDVQATDCVFGVGYRSNIGTTPYYGYASRYFDAVLRGKSLVEGELVIYYNKKKYLWTLLSRALGMAVTTDLSYNKPDDEMFLDVMDYKQMLITQQPADDISNKLAGLYDKYGSTNRADELEKMIAQAEENAWTTYQAQNTTLDPSELELAGPFTIILEVGKEREIEEGAAATEPAMRTILYHCFLTGKEKNHYQDDKILYTGYTFFARKEEDD